MILGYFVFFYSIIPFYIFFDLLLYTFVIICLLFIVLLGVAKDKKYLRHPAVYS